MILQEIALIDVHQARITMPITVQVDVDLFVLKGPMQIQFPGDVCKLVLLILMEEMQHGDVFLIVKSMNLQIIY